MTDTSRGTDLPARRAASSTPSAWTSDAATTAVGGSAIANSSTGELASRGAHVGAVLDVPAIERDARVGERAA